MAEGDANFSDKVQAFEALTDNERGATNGKSQNLHGDGGAGKETSTDGPFKGLGREEVLAESQKAQWVRLRWIFVGLFWAIWFALLIAAILLVYTAETCKTPHDTATQGAAYRIDPKKFNGGKLENIKDQLEYLDEMGVENVLLSPFAGSVENTDNDDINFKFSADESDDDLKELTESAIEKGLRIVVELFVDGVTKEDILYTTSRDDSFANGYFLAYDCAEYGLSGNADYHEANGSCVYMKKVDNKEYLQLNLENEKVVDLIKDTITRYITAGVNGFFVRNADKLVETVTIVNNTIKYSYDTKAASVFLTTLKKHISNKLADGVVIFEPSQASKVLYNNFAQELLTEADAADLLIAPVYSTALDLDLATFEALQTNTWWQSHSFDKSSVFGGPNSLKLFATAVCPGTPLFVAGDELGTVEDGTSGCVRFSENVTDCDTDVLSNNLTYYQMIRDIVAIRSDSPAFHEGQLVSHKIWEDSQIIYELKHDDFADFLIALNFGSSAIRYRNSAGEGIDKKGYKKILEIKADGVFVNEEVDLEGDEPEIAALSGVVLKRSKEE